MNALDELKKEIRERVNVAMQQGTNIDIADIHIEVMEVDADHIYVQGFGRDKKPSHIYIGQLDNVTSHILSQIKNRFRDAGPEAALNAVREDK